MADADSAGERFFFEPRGQSLQLALGAAARKLAMIEGGDAGRVIAAILEALERIDQLARDRPFPQNSDDPAHPSGWPLSCSSALAGGGKWMEIKTYFVV